MKIKLYTLLFLGAVIPSAFSSTFTGTIESLSFSSGTSPVRVSVRVDAPTSSECSGYNKEYYSYEYGDGELEKTWTSVLLAAHMTKREVQIKGTGDCDSFEIEKVKNIILM
jgi:hypothetical protein